MSSKKIDIILARYEEDIHWITSELSDRFLKNVSNIFVYNKSELFKSKEDKSLKAIQKDLQEKNINNINIQSFFIENIGRDSGTHLTHIVKNFNNLNDINIFLQAKPFPFPKNSGKDDHCPDFVKKCNQLSFMNYPYYPFGTLSCKTYYSGHIIGKNDNICKFKDSDSITNIFAKVFNKKFQPNSIKYLYHGNSCFSVTKARIHINPRQFYIKCKNLIHEIGIPEQEVRKLGYTGGDTRVHFFGRSWDEIFNKNKVKIESNSEDVLVINEEVFKNIYNVNEKAINDFIKSKNSNYY